MSKVARYWEYFSIARPLRLLATTVFQTSFPGVSHLTAPWSERGETLVGSGTSIFPSRWYLIWCYERQVLQGAASSRLLDRLQIRSIVSLLETWGGRTPVSFSSILTVYCTVFTTVSFIRGTHSDSQELTLTGLVQHHLWDPTGGRSLNSSSSTQ